MVEGNKLTHTHARAHTHTHTHTHHQQIVPVAHCTAAYQDQKILIRTILNCSLYLHRFFHCQAQTVVVVVWSMFAMSLVQ